MENQQELPTIIHENEEKTLKISYFGLDEIWIQSKSGIIAIHLGDIEWLQNTINNL